ncbi:MAG: pilus assembly protein N-terminal domain-containing protein, partial [Myxococcota bacterium]
MCLALLAVSQLRAESAERVAVQRYHSRTLNLGQPIRRIVVASPDIVLATQVAPDVVELYGERVGRSMVLVWTERGRLVLVVDVELEPQERLRVEATAIEQPRAGTGASLFAYRGTANLRVAEGVTVTGHQHTASAYQPIGAGQLFSFATADVVGLDERYRLGSFLLRYHDPLVSLQAGDVTTEAMPLLLSPTAIRGLAGTYHSDNVRLGAYGGLEPGGRHPALVFDATRTQRIGTFAELELAPNAALAVHALRRERVLTLTGPKTVTQIVPTLRWEPGPSLALEASGGVSELGHGWTTQLRYGIPVAQVGASYFMQGHGYLYPGAPRLDSVSANLVVRPSRRLNVWGVATRTTRGTFALAPRAEAKAVRDTESVQLSLFADPVFSQLQLGYTRSFDLGAPGATTPAIEIERQMWTFYADRALPFQLGRVDLRASVTDYAPVAGLRGAARLRQGDLTWQGTASFFTYLLGAGYSQSRAQLLDGTTDRRARYAINQTLGVYLTTVLAALRLQLTRDAVSE